MPCGCSCPPGTRPPKPIASGRRTASNCATSRWVAARSGIARRLVRRDAGVAAGRRPRLQAQGLQRSGRRVAMALPSRPRPAGHGHRRLGRRGRLERHRPLFAAAKALLCPSGALGSDPRPRRHRRQPHAGKPDVEPRRAPRARRLPPQRAGHPSGAGLRHRSRRRPRPAGSWASGRPSSSTAACSSSTRPG